MLAVSGGYDMRTPTSSATAVTGASPRASPRRAGRRSQRVSADNSFCALRAVRSWVTGGTVPATCQRPSFYVLPAPAYPSVAVPARAASPRATFVLAGKTIREAEAMWLATGFGSGAPVAGLFAGRLTPGATTSFRLDRYAIAPGVELTGKLDASGSGFPLSWKGTVTVSGKNAAHGKLTLKRDILTGTLGGVHVS